MANFRRRKPATRTCGRPFNKWKSRKLAEKGSHYSWLMSYPAWHDVIHHRRRARRVEKAFEHKVLMDEVDADDTAWPVSGKPHFYFW